MELLKPDVIHVLREFILKDVLGRSIELTDETPLIEEGHLTSLQTVELVVFIAERFGVEIEPEEIDETRFRSLDTIATLVMSKK